MKIIERETIASQGNVQTTTLVRSLITVPLLSAEVAGGMALLQMHFSVGLETEIRPPSAPQ